MTSRWSRPPADGILFSMPMRHASTAASRMTVDEWANLDDAVRGELVDGQLVEEEVVTYAHESAALWLAVVFHGFLVPRGGFVYGPEAKIAIREDRGRKPDVKVWWPGSRAPRGSARVARMAPDVAVEVMTHTPRDERRDRVEKRADYAAIRVKQYWLVDAEARTVEILQRSRNGRYVQILAASEGRHEIPGWGGFVLDLDAMWAEVDRADRA